MSDYTINRVSIHPPRTWSFTDKRTGGVVQMETYKVMLDGIDEPVDVNRKPGKFPVPLEVLTGTLEDSDFGKKFKPERKPFTPGGVGKDQDLIQAEWAIGQAVAWLSNSKPDPDDDDMSKVESLAHEFFAMALRVKAGKPAPTLDKVFPVDDTKPVDFKDVPDEFS